MDCGWPAGWVELRRRAAKSSVAAEDGDASANPSLTDDVAVIAGEAAHDALASRPAPRPSRADSGRSDST
jgi:hypothetical protein